MLRWSQRVIDLADGDPSKGELHYRVSVSDRLHDAGHRPGIAWVVPDGADDLRHGLAMARSADPLSYATVVAYVYFPGIPAGVLRPDDSAVREIEDALRIAERSGDDLRIGPSPGRLLGMALVHRHTDAERDRGQKLLAEASDVFCAGDTTWRFTARQRVLGT